MESPRGYVINEDPGLMPTSDPKVLFSHKASLTAVLRGAVCRVVLSADPACWGVNTSRERRPKHPLSGESRRFCQPAFEAALYLREKETHHVSMDLPQVPSCVCREGSSHPTTSEAGGRGAQTRFRPTGSGRPRGPALRLELSWAFQGQHLRQSPGRASSSPKGPIQTHTHSSRRARVYLRVFSFL